MSQICHFCGKKPQLGHSVSHANNKSRRRWMPNLRKAKVVLKGVVQTVRVCMRCLKAGKTIQTI